MTDPHDLVHDCLELIVEFLVVYSLTQLAVEHLLFDGSAVRDYESRVVQSGFRFLNRHIQIRVGYVYTLDVLIELENRIGVERKLRRVEADRFEIRSSKTDDLVCLLDGHFRDRISETARAVDDNEIGKCRKHSKKASYFCVVYPIIPT